MAKKCPNCGKMIANAARVCPICKTPVQAAGTPVSPNQEIYVAGSSTPPSPNTNAIIPGFAPNNVNQVPPSIPATPVMQQTQGIPSNSNQTIQPQNFTQQPGATGFSGLPVNPPVINGGNSASEGLKEMLFSCQGRINRLSFFLRYTLLTVAIIILHIIIYGILGEETNTAHILVNLLVIPYAIAIVMQYIKRLHDLDKSGKWALLFFIPLVNIFLLLWLFFKRGTIGPNKYGADPVV